MIQPRLTDLIYIQNSDIQTRLGTSQDQVRNGELSLEHFGQILTFSAIKFVINNFKCRKIVEQYVLFPKAIYCFL